MPTRSRRLERPGIVTVLAFLVLSIGGPASSRADSWTASARDQLYCLQSATPADRASVPAALPGDSPAESLAYWKSPAADQAGRLQRYLMLLASFSYLADRSDDPDLHGQLLRLTAIQARNSSAADPVALLQVLRCAHASLLTIAVEDGDAIAIDAIARGFILQYARSPVGPAAEDLPVVRALRDVSLVPESEALRLLVGLAFMRGRLLQAEDPRRARRLFAAAADALVAAGDTRRAWGLATEANKLSAGKAIAIEDRWRTFPAQYDVQRAEHGQASATVLANAMLKAFPFPRHDQLVDAELEHHVSLRLSEAESSGAHDSDGNTRANAWRLRAVTAVINPAGHGPLPMPIFRAAFTTLTDRDNEAGGQDALDHVWNHNKAVARDNYETAYRPMLATFGARKLNLTLSAARDRLHFDWQVSRWLSRLSRLVDVLPEKRTEIAGQVFEGMQLQSYGQLSVGAVEPLLKQPWPDDVRRNLTNFVTMQTGWGSFLRQVLSTAYLPDPMHTADVPKIYETFKILDVTHAESTKSLSEFRAYIRASAPAVAPLLNPVPVPLTAVQAKLQADEALVSVVATGDGVFVLSATAKTSSFRRAPMEPRRLDALVRRLRTSLLPGQTGGRISVAPFDAGAAFEIYAATLGLAGDVIRGKPHIFWYANGALASIPPGVLIRQNPHLALMTAAADLRRLAWVSDAYAISVLPELSLFSGYRTAGPRAVTPYAFIGIGAPGLSRAEIEGARASRSSELAGGLSERGLASLPKLPETAVELKRLATIFGEDRSLLLLGADANKANVKQTLKSNGGNVLAFATHGFVAGEITGMPEPSLLLDMKPGDANQTGLLSSSEISGLHIRGSLVILSACNTATSDGRPRGDSFTGLAKSFTQAGASALLVSHWPVASGPAADLSVRTIELSLQNRLPLASALARAMRDVRDAPGEGDLSTAHPFYWAPFVFVGDGGRGLRE